MIIAITGLIGLVIGISIGSKISDEIWMAGTNKYHIEKKGRVYKIIDVYKHKAGEK